MDEPTHVGIRAPQPGDGEALARIWRDAASYYAALNPELFQLPAADGLAQWCEGWALNSDEERILLRRALHFRKMLV